MRKNNWIKLIYNKCRCGKVCNCMLLGVTRRKKDIPVRIIGYDCKKCGIRKKVDLKDLE